MRGETPTQGDMTMTDTSEGGEASKAQTLQLVNWLGMRTEAGNEYTALGWAERVLQRYIDTMPAVTVADKVTLQAFTPLEDGTSRITIYTYGKDGQRIDLDEEDARKGQFPFNEAMRHLCGCEREGCIARNGYAGGPQNALSWQDFRGSLCGKSHPATLDMPTTPVMEGRLYHQKLRNVPKFTLGANNKPMLIKGQVLGMRIGGGRLKHREPRFGRNFDYRKGYDGLGCDNLLPSCKNRCGTHHPTNVKKGTIREQCWGFSDRDIREGTACGTWYRFVYVSTGSAVVLCYLDSHDGNFDKHMQYCSDAGYTVWDCPQHLAHNPGTVTGAV